MGACYGVGLLRHLPVMSEKEQEVTMLEFASKCCGPGVIIRQVIDTRVGEWMRPESIDGIYEDVTMRWVEPDEAEVILAFEHNEHKSAPYSQFSFLDGWQIFVPGPHNPRKPIELPLLNRESISLKINTLDQGIAGIQAINRKIGKYDDDFWKEEMFSCKEYISFHDNIVKALKHCVEHHLIYGI